MSKDNLKQLYVNLGPGIMLAGVLLYAISLVAASVYQALGTDIYSVPNHPLVFVLLFGMLLICIGGLSLIVTTEVRKDE